MLKQFFINRYFHKLCNKNFFKNDEEAIIGSAKNVIQVLKENIDYAKNPENNVSEEWSEFIINESDNLIKEINKTYKNKSNIIGLFFHTMVGYFVLQDKKSLLEDLREYYNELEEQ